MRVLFELLFDALIATVYFDGSLCHPVDPTFPTHQQQRRASCAAFIQFDEASKNMLGGRILQSCSSLTTSAEVEYKALILGLEGLIQHWPENHSSAEASFHRVNVLGDCKTVIQQMNGGSRPRKTESLYRRAMEAAGALQTRYPGVQFFFQHIPRTQNIVTDRLCSTILAEKQLRDDQAAVLALGSLGSDDALVDYLNSFLGKECNALIYSRRPDFYRYLSRLASSNKEWHTLIKVGERWSNEIQNVWPRDSQMKDELFVEALAIQLVGWEKLGNQKELLYRRRKHQHALSRHASIGERVERDLTRAPSVADLPFAPSKLECNDDDCPLLIQKWMKEATNTSVWTLDSAFWTETRRMFNGS
jgi:ribonuclease HI